MTLGLVLAGAALAALSGLPALLLRRAPERAQRAAVTVLLLGAALGVAGALAALFGQGPAPELQLAWRAPFAAFAVRLDRLSAVFLLPVFFVPAAGASYGLGYAPQREVGARAIRLQLAYGITTAALALVVIAANAVLFLAAWEAMALGGFLLVLTHHERPEVQRAAFVYLAASHVATLAVTTLFCILAARAGSFDFAALSAAGLPPSLGLFALALLGFGLKAGLLPLHFWLPGAHAVGPSHVSALLSAALLKMGLYGLLRVLGWCATPPLGWGLLLGGLGALSAVVGIAFALAQSDLKRLLAYSSVENVGIVALGAGLALVGRSVGEPSLVALGMTGALLHVVNHGLFKALLFLGAGAVQHATGTLSLDRLGGLGRRMPGTALLLAVGAVAVCGLPPLNGFASEWLVYLAAFRSASLLASWAPWAVLAAPALALTGGVAVAAFAKVLGIGFLGAPRSEAVEGAHEAPASMRRPMAALAAGCALLGLAAPWGLPALGRAAADWAGLPAGTLAPATAWAARSARGVTLVALVLTAAAYLLWSWRAARARGATASGTWSCGYERPTARMQYTGESFADGLAARFGWVLARRARLDRPEGPFPVRAAYDATVPDSVMERLVLPALRALSSTAERLRFLHRPQVQAQALLVGVTLFALLAWRFLAW